MMGSEAGTPAGREQTMKKLTLALALALAISPLTFAEAPGKNSVNMHKKGKHAKTRLQWRRGPDGTSLYKL
jgi:hypothetical protein